jgi:dienelactone hydrolase
MPVWSPDGTKLAATYYSGDQPGPGILLLHQCNKDRSSWNTLAERLASAGFHVLTMDYRGYGESGGKRHLDLPATDRETLTTKVWPGDVDAAFAYLRAQPGVEQVYGAGGASCGVNQSIQLSLRHPEVKSLVLLSGNTDRAGRQHLRSKSSPPLSIAAADQASSRSASSARERKAATTSGSKCSPERALIQATASGCDLLSRLYY